MRIMVAVIVTFLLVGSAYGQTPKRFLGFSKGQQGIGLLLGYPSGFRYSYWLNWRRAIMADLAYDFDGILLAQGSYGFYFYDARDQLKKSKGFNSFLFYLAPGVMTGVRVSGSDTASSVVLGARGVGGLEYIFGSGVWAARAELGGNINLVGRTFAGIQGMVGLTYYFGDRPDRLRQKSDDEEFEIKATDDEFESDSETTKKPKSTPKKSKSRPKDNSSEDSGQDEFSEFN